LHQGSTLQTRWRPNRGLSERRGLGAAHRVGQLLVLFLVGSAAALIRMEYVPNGVVLDAQLCFNLEDWGLVDGVHVDDLDPLGVGDFLVLQVQALAFSFLHGHAELTI